MTIHQLLDEDGSRWMLPDEQVLLGREYPRMERPVWLYLSLVAEQRNLHHVNINTGQHMDYLRRVFKH
jgi:hypothetical protein